MQPGTRVAGQDAPLAPSGRMKLLAVGQHSRPLHDLPGARYGERLSCGGIQMGSKGAVGYQGGLPLPFHIATFVSLQPQPTNPIGQLPSQRVAIPAPHGITLPPPHAPPKTRSGPERFLSAGQDLKSHLTEVYICGESLPDLQLTHHYEAGAVGE